MKQIYVRCLRLVAAVLRVVGVLGLLDRRAPRSRAATWVRSLFAIHDIDELARLGVPWWTFDSADRIAAYLDLRPDARIFEWGSGASTLWLAARAGTVHSVEHHAGWAADLLPRLPANVVLEVVEPAETRTPVVASRKFRHGGLDFSAYVDAIDRTTGSFDVIVIDGRAREACLAKAVTRLAPGGVIVFDNVDRQRYREAIASLGHRVEVTMTRGLTPALPYPTRTALLAHADDPAQTA